MRRNAGDEELRLLERAWQRTPNDGQLEQQYLAAWARAGFPGRDPRRDPVPGDIVQSFVGTNWRSRFDGEVRRFEVQGVVQEPSNDCSCFGRHYGQHDVDDCRGLRPRTRVYRRLLGTVGWSGQLFPPEEGQAIESDLLLRSWRAWASGGEVVRRMPVDSRGPSPRRRNSDEGLRDLERRAAAGDLEAARAVVFAKVRAGRQAELTIGELAALPANAVGEVMRGLPFELGGVWWRNALARAGRPSLPPMTHQEIMATLDGGERNEYERAIQEEAEAISRFRASSGRRRSPTHNFVGEAEDFYANDVSRFLEDPSLAPTPSEVFSNRRTVKAWAIAEWVRDALDRRATEEERERRRAGASIQDVTIGYDLARLFRAEISNYREMQSQADDPEDEDEIPRPTLGSAMDSVRSGYEPFDNADMDAIRTQLESLMATHGEDTLIEDIWDGEVPTP